MTVRSDSNSGMEAGAWRRSCRDGALQIGILIVVAAVCALVAVLWSAQSADDSAFEQERLRLVRALIAGALPQQADRLALADPSSNGMREITGSALLSSTALTDLGARLGLVDLRMADDALRPDHRIYVAILPNGETMRLAWIPHRPSAGIRRQILPAVAGGFIILVLLGLAAFRHLRRASAALMATQDQLRYLARHDPLCGLPNRAFFQERLESAIRDIAQGAPVQAVLYIDLDHFKDVNDTLGHPMGDALLCAVARRLARTVRADELVARLGGDEFAVLMSGTLDRDQLVATADQLIATLCATYTINQQSLSVGASIGIAIVDGRIDSAADVMMYADIALYWAKNDGRNRACVYDLDMNQMLSHRKALETDLRSALENGGLDVVYQPVTNAGGTKLVGVEALCRWQHPVLGNVEPNEFIPIAEQSGLIVALGEAVLRRACLDAKAWPGINLAVNVSPLQIRRSDFVDTVERVLAETGFDPRRLELELTESTLIGNIESADAAMRRIKTLGIRLALDDFGTGYSSLLYLRRFPFDKLKIDRSFVQNIEKASGAGAIVHAIVSLGRGLGMKVTAEGVESAGQHLFLRAAGVHEMQGYRFGRPCVPSDISDRLAHPEQYRSGIDADLPVAL